MTKEEAKNWLNKLYARADITDEYGDMEDMQPYEEAVNMAIQALEQKESYDFAKWVATEIFDDNWEWNKDAFAELACRKLAKLGIVRANSDKWELVETQESEE